MIRLGAIVLNAADTTRAAEFWGQALGFRPGAHPGFLVPPDGTGTRLHLDGSDRTHLDLWVDSAREQASEVQRLLALGAVRVQWDYPEGADFVVLADPSGNLFCIIDTGLAGRPPPEGTAT